MKNFLLGSLMLMNGSFAFCMEVQPTIPAHHHTVTPFYLPELRLLITEFLVTELSLEEALKALRAWALTDKKAWTAFHTQEATHAFIDWFNRFSYTHRFNVSALEKLSSLLQREELTNFNHSLEKGAELVKLFETCGAQKEWSTFIALVPALEKSTLSGYLAHYYWESIYNTTEAQKTLLSYALELQAPDTVINALISWGSRLTHLHKTTPPPCLLVCQNIITVAEEYEKKRAEQNLAQECTSTLKDLKNILHNLIKKGASVNDSFFKPNLEDTVIAQMTITPLFLAVKANNVELTNCLLSHGACCSQPLFFSILIDFADDKVSFSLMEALLRRASAVKGSSRIVQSLLRLTIQTALHNPNEELEEKYCTLIALFLTKKVAINETVNGLTLLDMTILYNKKDSKIASLLVQHGALLSNATQMPNLASKTTSFLERGQQEGATFYNKYTILPFLEEVKSVVLSHETLEVPQAFIFKWLAIALDVSSLQEGKEFWKCIALRFPGTPLFGILVQCIHEVKERNPNPEAYLFITQRAQELVEWLFHEGIKDTFIPTASSVAKKLGMEELASSLAGSQSDS